MPPERTSSAAFRGALIRSRGAILLVPAILALVPLAGAGGGFNATSWYPAALFAAGLLLVGLLSLRAAAPRMVMVAVAGLSAYAAWSYLSIAWAGQKADAWDGANRTLLYAIVFTLFALWRLRAPVAAAILALLVVAIAGLGLVELLRASGAGDPGAFFFEGRFSSPATYQNANVALWTMALWPAVVLASRRELPTAARSLLAAAAVVLAAAALLGQSRGWLFATPVTALVVVAIVPQRVRLVLTGLAVVAGVAIISGPLLDVYSTSGTARFPGAVDDAVRAIVLMAVLVAAAVGVASMLERSRPRPSAETERRAGRALLAAGIAAGVLALVVFVVAVGSPFTAISDGWKTFKTEPFASGSGSRFSQSLGSYRYDFWRVSLAEFKRHPIAGIGADNFQEPYLRQRRSSQEPRYPHSVELGVLSQTGLVGTLLLGGALAAALTAAALAIRRRRGLGAAVAAGGVTVFASWLIHGTVDWFWEFPALGMAAFAALGLAAGLMPREIWRERQLVAGRGVAVVAVCALVAALSLAAPWFSQRWVDEGIGSWRASPQRSFARLGNAADANPLSPLPWLYAGSIAIQLNRYPLAESYFRRALERDPGSQYAELELGLIAARAGRRADALAHLRRSEALNPRDEIGDRALRQVARGRSVDIQRLNRALAAESEQVIR
jgi:hypothetical protein